MPTIKRIKYPRLNKVTEECLGIEIECLGIEIGGTFLVELGDIFVIASPFIEYYIYTNKPYMTILWNASQKILFLPKILN